MHRRARSADLTCMDYFIWENVKSIVYGTPVDSAEDFIVATSGETKALLECLRMFELPCSEDLSPASHAEFFNSNPFFGMSCTSVLLLLILCL